MHSRDVLALLGLVRHSSEQGWTVQSLAKELRLPPMTLQRALMRLDETPVYDAERRRLNWSATTAFFEHALPFVAPVRLGAPTRGIATAWAAPPLSDAIGAGGDLPPVWPYSDGQVRGLALPPLHGAALVLAASDAWMYEMLALVDGIRAGDARVRALASDLLRERLDERERS
jgi:hypothetical protein